MLCARFYTPVGNGVAEIAESTNLKGCPYTFCLYIHTTTQSWYGDYPGGWEVQSKFFISAGCQGGMSFTWNKQRQGGEINLADSISVTVQGAETTTTFNSFAYS